MEKTNVKRLAGAMFAAAAMCFCACSSNSEADVYSLASANDMAVVRADAKTLIENAGGSITPDGIDFPADLMTGMSKEACTALSARGIDMNNVVMNITSGNEIGVAFSITDPKAFDEYLTEVFPNAASNEEKGYTFRKVGDETYVFSHSDMGYMLQANDNGVDRLQAVLDAAKKNPLSTWQKTALAEGNALGLIYNVGKVIDLVKEKSNYDLLANKMLTMQIDSAQLATSFMKMNFTLEGTKLTANSQLVSNDGNALKSKLDSPDVDTSLLKYAGPKDQFVTMMAMPQGVDWNEMTKGIFEMVALQTRKMSFNNPATAQAVAQVLGDIDGTVMFAMGAPDTTSVDGVDAVLAVQMKEGKAADYLKQIQAMASLYGKMLNFTTTLTDGNLTIKGQGFSAYGKADGNVLVLSLSPITGKGGCTHTH